MDMKRIYRRRREHTYLHALSRSLSRLPNTLVHSMQHEKMDLSLLLLVYDDDDGPITRKEIDSVRQNFFCVIPPLFNGQRPEAWLMIWNFDSAITAKSPYFVKLLAQVAKAVRPLSPDSVHFLTKIDPS